MNRLLGTHGLGLGGALILHGGLLSYLFLAEPPRGPEPARAPPVKIRLTTRAVEPRPAPAPIAAEVAKPEPPAPTPPLILEKPKPPSRRPEPKPTPQPAPPAVVPEPVSAAAPVADAPPVEPPRPRKFTVAMDATLPGGGVAVPVSGDATSWAAGAPDGDPSAPRTFARAGVPGTANPGDRSAGSGPSSRSGGGPPVLPRLLAQPSGDEMQAAYPVAARREGLEANVDLRVLVDAEGRVSEVQVVRAAGSGFDEAAVRLVKKFRFAAGVSEGKAVAMWINWTYKFRLDG